MKSILASALQRVERKEERAHLSEQQIERYAQILSQDDIISIIAIHVRDEAFEFLLESVRDDVMEGVNPDSSDQELLAVFKDIIEDELPPLEMYKDDLKKAVPKKALLYAKRLPWQQVRDYLSDTEEEDGAPTVGPKGKKGEITPRWNEGQNEGEEYDEK